MIMKLFQRAVNENRMSDLRNRVAYWEVDLSEHVSIVEKVLEKKD